MPALLRNTAARVPQCVLTVRHDTQPRTYVLLSAQHGGRTTRMMTATTIAAMAALTFEALPAADLPSLLFMLAAAAAR